MKRSSLSLTLSLAALLLAALLAPTPASAHPFSKTSYSARSALRIGDSGLKAVAVLEVPAQFVLDQLTAMAGEGKKPGRAHLKKLNEQTWAAMGAALTLKLDGEAVSGEWKAVKNDINGKGAEGFFVYLVAFVPLAPLTLGERAEITVINDGWRAADIYLSGMARADEGWAVESCSAEDLLGDGSRKFAVNEPGSWSRDEALRTLRAVFVKEPSPPATP